MKLELQNLLDAQPIISQQRLLRIAQSIDIGFSIILWCTYLLAILASFQHVAWAFSLLEEENQKWVGYLAAAAVDGALAVMAYTIQQRRRQRRVNREMGVAEAEGTQALWIGLIFLGGISVIANFLHGIHVELHTDTLTLHHLLQLDALQWVRLVTNAIALPLIVVYLGEVVSVPGAGGVITNLLRSNKTLQRDLTAGQAAISDLHTQVDKLDASQTQSQSELNEKRVELDQIRSALVEMRSEHEQLLQTVNNRESELNKMRSVLTTTQSELDETRSTLNIASAEANQAQQTLNTVQTELAQKRSDWEQAQGAADQFHAMKSVLDIPVQEAIQYLIHRAQNIQDSQDQAARRASDRAGQPVTRATIARILRVIEVKTDQE